MADFNDPLPSTHTEPQLTPREQAEADAEDQILSEEARALSGTRADVDLYSAELELNETERRQSLDVIEGLRKLETGDPVRWTIYRVDANDPEKLGYLADWSTARLNQNRIRDEFGPGVYRIEGHLPNGRYVKRRTVTIAEDAPRRIKDSMSQSTQSGFNPTEFLAQQSARDAQFRREQDQRDANAKKERDEREEKAQARTERMLALILPVVGTIGAAITTAFSGGGRGSQMADIAALMTAMKGPAPPDPISMLVQLKALEKSSSPDIMNRVLPMLIDMAGERASGGDTGWLDVVKELVKSAGPAVGGMVQAAMEQANATRAAQPLPNPQAASINPPNMPPAGAGLIVVPESRPRRERMRGTASNPSAVVLPGSPPTQLASGVRTVGSKSPSDGGNNMSLFSLMPHLPWLREMLGLLLTAASRGKDPEVYAALFLEELPEDIDAPTILALLGPESWFQQLCSLESRWNDARLYPWIERVRHLILSQVAPEAGQEPARDVAHGPPPVPQTHPSSVPAPAPRAKPQNAGEVDRPMKLPSLTGD